MRSGRDAWGDVGQRMTMRGVTTRDGVSGGKPLEFVEDPGFVMTLVVVCGVRNSLFPLVHLGKSDELPLS